MPNSRRTNATHSAVNARALVLAAGMVANLWLAVAAAQPPTPPVPPPAPGEPVPTVPVPAAPAADPTPAANPAAPGKMIFLPSAEPVQLSILIEMVRTKLGLQVVADTAVQSKSVIIATQVEIDEAKLLPFLSELLRQSGLSLTKSSLGEFYQITPLTDVPPGIGNDPFSPTQIIPTRGLKPSSLQGPIATVLRGGGGPGGGAQPNPVGGPGAAGGTITYLDDLGVILMNDAPSKIQLVVDLIRALDEQVSTQQYIPFSVKHISATAAKSRMVGLLTNQPQRGGLDPTNPANAAMIAQQQQQGGQGAQSGSLSNLADRLTPEAGSNRLIFKGRPDETAQIARLLALVDVPNALTPKWYPVGGAQQLAQLLSQQGLGSVLSFTSSTGGPNALSAGGAQPGSFPGQPGAQSANQSSSAGPVFIVDTEGKGFTFYGTPEQQTIIERMVKDLAPMIDNERPSWEIYRLSHSKAKDVATLIRDLMSNTVSAGGSSALLPGGGNQPRRANNPLRPPGTNPLTPTPSSVGSSAGAGEIDALEDNANVFVREREETNEVIVKAPRRLQPQFQRLITRLDQRRPQVYIDTVIVTVDDNDSFRLSVENQFLQFGGQTLAGRTNFGVATSIPTANNGILSVPVVNPISGITAALIKSNQVPIVISALSTNTDARVAASPKLLVDDNEEAELEAIEERPTQTQSQVGGSNQLLTGFAGYEPAGPKLKVKPSISAGDFVRLEYEVTLSSFNDSAAGAQPGLPPARSTTTVKSKSVTIPSDSTIVVGGLTLENTSQTVLKVPLLGDVPLVGHLFRSQSTASNRRRVYVFITPRIMRDPWSMVNFSRGPAAAVEIPDDLPPTQPVVEKLLPPPPPLPTAPSYPMPPVNLPAPGGSGPALVPTPSSSQTAPMPTPPAPPAPPASPEPAPTTPPAPAAP